MSKFKNKKSGYVCIETIFLLFFACIISYIGISLITNNLAEKPISTDISVVEVEIVKTVYEEETTSTDFITVDDKGTIVPMDNITPELFVTVIRHQDHTHNLYGKETYDFCYGKDETTTKANVYVDTYKSGEQKHTIEVILE